MSDDVFEQLHTELTKQLLARVKDGTATAADLNVARQWLNDNKIAADPRKNSGLKALDKSISSLPFDAD
jgi:hypothetical protein